MAVLVSESEFTTDGCSGFTFWVWSKLAGPPPWEGDCVEHDRAYWRGGTAEERKAADLKLRESVAARGHPVVAAAMYYGVRAGGVAWLPTSWRWGYGRKA